LPLAACGDQLPATGQVLVSVGGEAITKRDLQGEYAAAAQLGVPGDTPGPALERLVQRTLLLRAARDAELDLTPEYLAAIRRARGDILIGMFNERIAAQLPPPSAAEVQAFIAARPWMFGAREIVTLAAAGKQPAPADGTQVDTAQLSAGEAKALLASGDRPVLLGGTTGLVTAQAREPAPLVGAAAERVAAAIIRRERQAAQLEKIVARERHAVPIRYRQGFGPAIR
jgi:hypothetical protein